MGRVQPESIEHGLRNEMLCYNIIYTQSITRQPIWHVYFSDIELHYTLFYYRDDIWPVELSVVYIIEPR
jgi:hypothetical protein